MHILPKVNNQREASGQAPPPRPWGPRPETVYLLLLGTAWVFKGQSVRLQGNGEAWRTKKCHSHVSPLFKVAWNSWENFLGRWQFVRLSTQNAEVDAGSHSSPGQLRIGAEGHCWFCVGDLGPPGFQVLPQHVQPAEQVLTSTFCPRAEGVKLHCWLPSDDPPGGSAAGLCTEYESTSTSVPELL